MWVILTLSSLIYFLAYSPTKGNVIRDPHLVEIKNPFPSLNNQNSKNIEKVARPAFPEKKYRSHLTEKERELYIRNIIDHEMGMQFIKKTKITGPIGEEETTHWKYQAKLNKSAIVKSNLHFEKRKSELFGLSATVRGHTRIYHQSKFIDIESKNLPTHNKDDYRFIRQ